MKYVSTRGAAPVLGFGDVLLTGLASDGGLYVPEEWPQLSSEVWSEVRPYDAVAVDVMWPFVEGSIERDDFEAMVAAAYATFDHPDVCPVVELGDLHLLELFWGPTLAFKDVALQLVGRLFDHELAVARPTGDDRGRDLRRHGLRRDRSVRRPRPPRHRRAPPLGPCERRPTSPDDHGRCAQRAQRGGRGHLRRLPGHREGALRRPRVPRCGAPLGDELHQLGSGDGAGRVLRHDGGPARSLLVRGAHRQLRQHLLRLDRRTDGPSDRPAGDRLEQQRHPHAVGRRRFVDRTTRGAHLQPVDGHPGVLQPRAVALRAERPRWRADRRAPRPLPRPRGGGGAPGPPVPGRRARRCARPWR